jgi:hypothetical protein
MTKPPRPAASPPPRVRGASRAEARGKVDGEKDHEDHAEEAVLYKGYTFAYARRGSAHQTAGRNRPPAKNQPKSNAPSRRKKGSVRSQIGDQQDHSSEIEHVDEQDDDGRITPVRPLRFNPKDNDHSTDGNDNEGARAERRMKQIRLSNISLGGTAFADKTVKKKLDRTDLAELLYSAANQIRSSAVDICKKSAGDQKIQPLSQAILAQILMLMETGSSWFSEHFTTLASVREILIKLPAINGVNDKETIETINLILPIVLLNAGNPRTDRMRNHAKERNAMLKHGLAIFNTRR